MHNITGGAEQSRADFTRGSHKYYLFFSSATHSSSIGVLLLIFTKQQITKRELINKINGGGRQLARGRAEENS